MKTFQLTAKKKITLALLVVIALALLIFIINVQMNQPDNLPANYMERLKNPGMTGITSASGSLAGMKKTKHGFILRNNTLSMQ